MMFFEIMLCVFTLFLVTMLCGCERTEQKDKVVDVIRYFAASLKVTNLYKVKHGRFSCKSMKGDDIKLENSYVEYIEYTKNLNISDDCKVEKSVKVS